MMNLKARLSRSASVAVVLCAASIAQGAQAQTSDSAGVDADSPEPQNAIIVTGIRQSLARAAEIKQNSVNVVDSIVAQDIGKLPDATTAAALQRIPGVQVVVGSNNEIQSPIIRGLGDILSTLNGREIFTGVGRGFSFQDLPSAALAGVDVYKSNSADLIEGGVAGVINLRLRRAFDFKKFTVAGNLQLTHADEKGIDSTNNPQASLLIADRWNTGIGEIGALINVSYQHTKYSRPVLFNDYSRSTNHAPAGSTPGLQAPTGVGGAVEFGTYERPQANFSLQWRPSSSLEIYTEGLYAGYRGHVFQAKPTFRAFNGSSLTAQAGSRCDDYAIGPDGYYSSNVQSASNPTGTGMIEHLCDATGYTATNIESYIASVGARSKTDIYTLAGGFKYESGPLSVDTDLSYEKSENRNNSFRIDIGKHIAELDLVRDQDHGASANTPGNPLNDPDDFTFANGMSQDINHSVGTLVALQSNAKYELNGLLKYIEGGVRLARRKADFQQYLGGPAAPGGSFVTPVASVGLPSDFLVGAPAIPTLNDGAGYLQADPHYLIDENIKSRLREIYGISGTQPDYDPTRNYHAAEKTYAGFLQGAYEIPLGGGVSVDGLIGLRLTRTDRDIEGAGRVTDPATGTSSIVPVTRSTTDTDLLPNASARVRFGGGMQARFNYSETIARPSFASLNPGLSYVVSYVSTIQNAGSGGNPDLKAQKSTNYDATLEYYFGSSSYLSAGLYYRDIRNRVVTGTTVMTIDGLQYVISLPRNLGSAELKGLELGGQVFFDFLPGALGGLGVLGNFTIADSKATTKDDRLEGLPLLGVSKYSYNAGLIYERAGVSARLVYTYRSHYFDSDNTNGLAVRPTSTTVFLNGVRATGRLDFGLNYDITRNITISLTGTNITGSKTRTYENVPWVPRDTRFDDTTYALGARFLF